jgi:hypothetical protein
MMHSMKVLGLLLAKFSILSILSLSSLTAFAAGDEYSFKRVAVCGGYSILKNEVDAALILQKKGTRAFLGHWRPIGDSGHVTLLKGNGAFFATLNLATRELDQEGFTLTCALD